jgi:hypothetical protein
MKASVNIHETGETLNISIQDCRPNHGVDLSIARPGAGEVTFYGVTMEDVTELLSGCAKVAHALGAPKGSVS